MTSKPKGRTLAEFQPLLPAEQKLLTACASGEVAVIGKQRPKRAIKTNRVRAEFLRFLALGGDEQAAIHEHGVQLFHAWVSGVFDLENAQVPHGLLLANCHLTNTPVLHDAKIAGLLNLHGSKLPGMSADRVHVEGGVFLRTVTASGEIRLLGGQIGGNLDCTNAKLDGKDGDALSADGAMIQGSVFLQEATASGEIRLLGAQIGGNLDCTNAKLDGKDGNALSADRAHLEGGVYLSEMTASGAIRLLGAQIGGDLSCTNAKLDGKDGNALSADGAMIQGSVFLQEATASGEIRLLGAQIGSNLDCTNAKLDGKDGDALSTDGAIIKGGFFFRDLTQPVNGVSLAAVHVGQLIDDRDAWGEQLTLDGFTYGSFAGGAPTDATTRLAWLDKQLDYHSAKNGGQEHDFRPQPWRQLQKVLRDMGHTEDARQVAIALEHRLYHANEIGQCPQHWPKWRKTIYRSICRSFHLLFWIFIGFGYRPLRLGVWMVSVWLVCAGWFWFAALAGVMGPSNPLVFQNPEYAACVPDNEAAKYEMEKAQAKATGRPIAGAGEPVQGAGNWYLCGQLREEYTGFSPFAYSLDVLLPLVNLQQETDWAPLIPTPRESWYAELGRVSLKHFTRLVVWFEILFGWVASLLLVAVVSGLTKRRED